MRDNTDNIDVVGVTDAECGDIQLDTDLMRAQLTGNHSTGVRIIRGSDRVYLVAGADDGSNRMTTAQLLSPETAREVAATLQEAADEAEGMAEPDTEPDEDSILGRLLR
jgi:hypothetical protein